MKKLKQDSEKKKPSFLQKRIEKTLTPIIDKVLYASFYFYVDTTGNKDMLTYDDYCLCIRDLLAKEEKKASEN